MMKPYTGISKFFHWVVALIVIPMVLGSFYLEDLPESIKGTGIMLHKSFGLTVLFLMVLRLVYILRVGRPKLPETVKVWEKILSRVVQYALYGCLFMMPLCGWIMSTAAGRSPVYFGWVMMPFPGIVPDKPLSDLMFQIHQTTAYVIIGLLMLHIAGAWKHYLIDKDTVMSSMLPFGRKVND